MRPNGYGLYLIGMINCVFLLILGCSINDKSAAKNSAFSLITTPINYYSTAKARYLGERYRENLDRIVERIVRNSKTSTLQFANNIATVGGIGFFTHSATKTADERYLEVVLGASETFEGKGEQSGKVLRLFSMYGTELMSILAADGEIFHEKEVAGYGLNLSWRTLIPESSGTRVTLERAIVYVPKDRARSFLKQEISQDRLLADAAIFTAEEDAPMRLVSYRPPELKPDYRPSVQEETIMANKQTPRANLKPAVAMPAEKTAVSKIETANALKERSESSEEETDGSALGERAPAAVPAARIEEAGALAARSQAFQEKQAGRGPESSEVQSNAQQAKSVPPAPKPQQRVDGQAPQVAAKKDLTPVPERRIERAASSRSLSLQGYIIQLSFVDRTEGQRWAETLERRGHAVSVTEPGGGGAVRVRIGNFAQRGEAERQLQRLQKDGLSGIVLNIPQAYQPQAATEGLTKSGTGLPQ